MLSRSGCEVHSQSCFHVVLISVASCEHDYTWAVMFPTQAILAGGQSYYYWLSSSCLNSPFSCMPSASPYISQTLTVHICVTACAYDDGSRSCHIHLLSCDTLTTQQTLNPNPSLTLSLLQGRQCRAPRPGPPLWAAASKAADAGSMHTPTRTAGTTQSATR